MLRRNELLSQILFYTFGNRTELLYQINFLDDTISLWNLGREDFSIDEFKSYRADTINIAVIVSELEKEFGSELLGILLNDILENVNVLQSRKEFEGNEYPAKYLQLKDFLEKRYIDILHTVYQEKIEYRSANHAIGYLFIIALVVDETIKKIELNALKQDLNAWSSNSARAILYYFDFYMKLYSAPSALYTFRSELTLSGSEKSSLLECLQYLKNSESPAKLKIIHEQVMKIIKSDNIIHENERWIYNQMNHYWKT